MDNNSPEIPRNTYPMGNSVLLFFLLSPLSTIYELLISCFKIKSLHKPSAPNSWDHYFQKPRKQERPTTPTPKYLADIIFGTLHGAVFDTLDRGS